MTFESIIIGYINQELTFEESIHEIDLKLSRTDGQDNTRIISLYISTNTEEFNAEINKFLNKFFPGILLRDFYYDNLYFRNYDKIKDKKIKTGMNYWLIRKLQNLSKVIVNEDLVEQYLALSETFGFTEELPGISAGYTLLNDDSNLKTIPYIQSIDKDAKIIRDYIDSLNTKSE